MKQLQRFLLLVVLFHSSEVIGQRWKMFSDSAKIFQQENQNEKAIEYFIKANEILRLDSAWTETHGRIANTIGGMYWRKGQYREAGEFGEEALKVCERILTKAHPFYATSCHNLGMVYSTLGDYDKSEMYYLEAKKIRELLFGKKNRDYAATCNTLGILYNDIGQYHLSEQYLLEAQQSNSASVGKNSSEYALGLINLAGLYKKTGIIEKSEPLYTEALEIWNGLNIPRGQEYASICINLANLYTHFAKFDKAEKLLLEARRILGKTPGTDHPDYATGCHSLAALYMSKGQYQTAEPYLFEARKVYEKANGKLHPDFAKNANAIGALYSFQSRYVDAEKYFEESMEISEKLFGNEHPDYASTCHDLGGLYVRMGRYEEACTLLIAARQIFEKNFGSNNHDFISTTINLANLYVRLNQIGHALALYKIALSSQQNLMGRTFLVTSENERLTYLKQTTVLNDETFSLIVTREKEVDKKFLFDLALSSRNILLTYSRQLRQEINNSQDTGLVSKYNSWINLREKISYIYSQPKIKRPVNFEILEEQSDQYEKEIIRYFSRNRSFSQFSNFTVSDLRKHLLPGEAAIEFVAFRYSDSTHQTDSTYYIALILRKDRPEPELVKLFEEKQINELLKVYKGTSAGPLQANFLYANNRVSEANGKSLYDLVWKPLENKLAGITKIYFAPAGSLFKVSFAALPAGRQGVLSDKYQMVQLNTTASLIDQPATPISTTDRLILYGGVQYDVDSTSMRLSALKSAVNEVVSRSIPDDLSRDAVPEFHYLEGTAKEITYINKLAEQKKYTINMFEGKDATEESFKTMSGKNSPSILHIATHGFFFPDPLNSKQDDRMGGREVFRQSENPLIRSGLALASANNAWKGKPVAGVEDGILTAYEVSNMYLPNTKLAVLSACETGLGDIQGSEGVYGLQRAFKMAGVENLVMSLWKVPDGETAEFMQQFYKNLFGKQTIQDAFYNAQTIMKNKYRKEPYKWAAWTLIR